MRTTIWTRADVTPNGKVKLEKIIRYESGKEVAIPINQDGSIKWYDDSKLIKK